MTRNRYLQLLTVFIGVCSVGLLTRCSFSVPHYPEPILLGESSVSIEYTFGTVDIAWPVKIIDGHPTAYRLRFYSGKDTTKPVIDRMLLPGDPIAARLPRSLFLPDTLVNWAELIPLGGDYPARRQSFSYTGPIITLDTTVIQLRPVIIEGAVRLLRNGAPVPASRVTVTFPSGREETLPCDTSGAYRFVFPAQVLDDSSCTVRTVAPGSYPAEMKSVTLNAGKQYRVDFWVGPTAEFFGKGAPYIVLEDLLPFRTGPENGATIQFLLPRDEIIMVTTVAGNRLKAIVELRSETGEKPHYVEGWVPASKVKPVEL
ncbi:MAG: carboxypeptidase regulatory-like domain-containing protein [Candidatus Neomarinimicrobiota bacterium]|nr:MAG: carboxypeptidase regulatory-like domain-containing protein [Candidatus Neomarinimicrobiota bacterium]